MTTPKTIAELIEIHGKPTPEKPLRVRNNADMRDVWFDIIYDRRTCWYPAYNHNGAATVVDGIGKNWLLVEPEPEYETRYAYAVNFYDYTEVVYTIPRVAEISNYGCPTWGPLKPEKLPEDQFPPIKVRVKK